MVKYGNYRQNVPSYNFHIWLNDILFLTKRRMEMNRLRELREDRDLYQKDIAKLIHIDQFPNIPKLFSLSTVVPLTCPRSWKSSIL